METNHYDHEVQSGGLHRTPFGDVTISVAVSDEDGAPVVFIDTTFEPDDTHLRVRVNDALYDLSSADEMEQLNRERAPYPPTTYDDTPWCPACGDGRLMLVEAGYERGWFLRWEEMDDELGKRVLFAADDEHSDEGDGKYFVRCASCLTEYAAPEAGPEEEGGWSWA